MRASLPISSPSKSFWFVLDFQLEVLDDFIGYPSYLVGKICEESLVFINQFIKHAE